MDNNNIKIIYKYINTTKRVKLFTTSLCLFFYISASSQNQADIQLANEYILKGDKKKAIELYRDISKSEINTVFIYNNYLNALLDVGEFGEAQDFVKKMLKRDPANIQYKLDAGVVMIKAGEMSKADKYFRELINQQLTNVQSVKIMAEYFSARSLFDYGILALNETRKVTNNQYLFSLDLAMLYRLKGEKDKMVNEYLNYVTQTSANIQYVKNVMQALLTDPTDLQSLEKLLYSRVQQNPEVEVYSDLLVWVSLQQKNFYGAFVQARAYDKRFQHDGEKCMEVARVALDNDDVETASRVYKYVMREYSKTSNYFNARLGLIKSREIKIKNSYPVQKDSVKILVSDYQSFSKQYPDNANALEAIRSEAQLQANYLDQKDSAVVTLQKLIGNPRASQFLKSKAKLDLGDIYMMKGEPWESTLLYSQVEKIQKENPLGYEAKLKNAKLSYYKGDFQLAQEHLDILKQATTREIANDALDLSMRIKENIAFDSVGEALKEYAKIELLLQQNKTEEALGKLEFLKQGLSVTLSKEEAFLHNIHTKQLFSKDSTVTVISNQTILDDVYWLEADIRLKQGDFQKAISLLQKILNEYPEDILADDAFFKEAEIYERHLNDVEKAKEHYREFLNKYPGSVFVAEARKRYRSLRGDFVGQEPQL